jgi:plasmid stabilization system protein ParE
MIRIALWPRARQDLDEIWDYTGATWGPEQAEAYTR